MNELPELEEYVEPSHSGSSFVLVLLSFICGGMYFWFYLLQQMNCSKVVYEY